jgi:BMFP domain-containing protein YqiC
MATTETELDRYEQTALTRERIDREAGILYGVRLLGTESLHGYRYAIDAQKAVVGRFEGMALGVDHDYDGRAMRVGDAWGTITNPRVDDRGSLGDVRYLKSHDRTEQILEDAERGIGLFSISPVCTACVEDRATRTVTSFAPKRCDLVVRGATTRTLFEQFSGGAQDMAVLRAENESLRQRVAALEAANLRHEQSRAGAANLEEKIKITESAFDLKKFWND